MLTPLFMSLWVAGDLRKSSRESFLCISLITKMISIKIRKPGTSEDDDDNQGSFIIYELRGTSQNLVNHLFSLWHNQITISFGSKLRNDKMWNSNIIFPLLMLCLNSPASKNPKNMQMSLFRFRVFAEWNQGVPSPIWGRIILRSCGASFFWKWTETVAAQNPQKPNPTFSQIFV